MLLKRYFSGVFDQFFQLKSKRTNGVTDKTFFASICLAKPPRLGSTNYFFSAVFFQEKTIRPEFVASNLTKVLCDTGHKRAVAEQGDVLFNSIVFAKVLRAICNSSGGLKYSLWLLYKLSCRSKQNAQSYH